MENSLLTLAMLPRSAGDKDVNWVKPSLCCARNASMMHLLLIAVMERRDTGFTLHWEKNWRKNMG